MDKTNPIRKYYVVPIVIAIVSIIVFSQIWKLLLVRFFPYLLVSFFYIFLIDAEDAYPHMFL